MTDEILQPDETPESVPADETAETPAADEAVVAGEGVEESAETSIRPVSDQIDGTSAEEPNEPAGEDDGGEDCIGEDDIGEDDSQDESARRAFLTQVLAGSIGAVVGLVPVLSGLIFFLDPLIRGGQSSGLPTVGGGVQKDAEGFIKLPVTRSLLPSDGTPQQVTVEDDLVDAWNKFPNVPIGSVWLLRSESEEVTAFSTICPHLGCAVEFRGARRDFYCPCHLSAFKLDGSKDNPIPPRDMDSLAVKPGMGEEIWVQYRSFRGGISEKVEV